MEIGEAYKIMNNNKESIDLFTRVLLTEGCSEKMKALAYFHRGRAYSN